MVYKKKTATKRNRSKSRGTASRRKVNVKAKNAKNVTVAMAKRP